MIENVIIYDGKKIYAFFPEGEMYTTPFGLEYKQSECLGHGMTCRKKELTNLYNWTGKAGIDIYNAKNGVSEQAFISVMLETVPRPNSFTGGITHFNSQFCITEKGFEQDVRIVYHTREKFTRKGRLQNVRSRRWVVDPVNPEVPEKYLILSHLEQGDHGLVKSATIKYSPAQAIKRLIKRHIANFRDQARDDLAEKLEKQLIWEIWFNEQGEIEVLKYNINEPGTSVSLNALMGIY